MNNCVISGCNNKVYKSELTCILHCEKSQYIGCTDPKFYEEFTLALETVVYNQSVIILKQLKESLREQLVIKKPEGEDYSEVTEETLKGPFKPIVSRSSFVDKNVENQHRKFFVQHLRVILAEINFPSTENNSSIYEFSEIFDNVNYIKFEKCKFWNNELPENKTKEFTHCDFRSDWILHDSVLDKAKPQYLYCSFFKNVGFKSNTDREIRGSLFESCEFHGKLEFINIKFRDFIFIHEDDIDTRYKKLKLADFRIIKCNFNEKFQLNLYEIDEFQVKDSVFSSKFEFKNNTIKRLKIKNTNFKQLVDNYGTHFRHFYLEKSIFDDFVGFENCKFGVSGRVILPFLTGACSRRF